MQGTVGEAVQGKRGEGGHHSLLSTSLWVLFILLIVYPLSLGPAARLHKKWLPARPVIEAAYAPVVWVIRKVPAVEHFYIWYVTKVWRVD